MASITVMKNYVIKKAQGTSDENLKKIVKVLKNYNKLDAESKSKVGSAVEKLYTKFKAQESKQSEPKKAGTTPPKSSGSKKKFNTQDLKGVIAEFKKKVGAKAFKQATSNSRSIKQDAERPALPKGKRLVTKKGTTSNQFGTFKNKVGRPYWENRSNRFDIKQPAKKYPILANGGEIEFIDYKEHEIMYEPTMNKYYANDVEFDTLDQAKKFLDSGKMSSDLRGAYARGLFAKGGEIGKFNGKPFSFYKYDTKKVKIAWKGKIQPFGAFYSVEDAIEELKKHYQTQQELREYSIVTPDGIIHYGKEYPITYAKGGEVGNWKEFYQMSKDASGYNAEYEKKFGSFKYQSPHIQEILRNSKSFEDFMNRKNRFEQSKNSYAKGGDVGTIGKFKYEITMKNNIEGPFVIAKFIAKGDALICLNALQKATSTKGMRYTLKEA